MARRFWILFGGAAQLLFLATVPFVFLLLYAGGGDLLGIEPAGWRDEGTRSGVVGRLALDLLLLGQFAVSHSLLLHPRTRSLLVRVIPSALYGAVFCAATCLSLLLTAFLWRPLPGVVWHATGWAGWVILTGFLASWGWLFYAVALTGPGWQTGFTPWRAYLRGRPAPRREFVTGNAYALLRHPAYLGFLGLLWFVPRMTTDRLLMAAVWTVYVFVGSVLKDYRLSHYLGDRYRAYAGRTPGYPLVPVGPLARWKKPAGPASLVGG